MDTAASLAWLSSFRSLNTLRPGEFVALLLAGSLAGFGISVAFAVHIPPILGLALWILPLGLLYWIARRRKVRTERKLRLLSGEDVCLNCGYLVNGPGVNPTTIDRCPECGDDRAEHRVRARVRLPSTFVFPELELASSDAQANEWLRTATARVGWFGRHPLFSAILAMLALTSIVHVGEVIATAFLTIPDGLKGPGIAGVIAIDMVILFLILQLWHKRMSRAIHALRSESR